MLRPLLQTMRALSHNVCYHLSQVSLSLQALSVNMVKRLVNQGIARSVVSPLRYSYGT